MRSYHERVHGANISGQNLYVNEYETSSLPYAKLQKFLDITSWFFPANLFQNHPVERDIAGPR